MKSFKNEFIDFIHQLQDEICSALEKADGKSKFIEDKWEREGGGGGKTRVIANGNVFEKGGVNTSVVYGTLPESMQNYLKVEHSDFFACGISLVIHPFNPMVPTVHANFRYFELYDQQKNVVDQWFAGGADLTPYYLFEEDALHFHTTFKNAADPFDLTLYPLYKKQCDEYFHNHHRGEARGIGGVFFDYLKGNETHSAEFWFDFTKSNGNAFIDAYLPIVERRKHLPFSDHQKHWQEIRRGRYVEFNLIHDKGTLFGLKTNGRIESILMSLPATVRWEYNFQPVNGSEEEKLLRVLKGPKNWIN
jgi:coproporphyrinogen III oxidase